MSSDLTLDGPLLTSEPAPPLPSPDPARYRVDGLLGRGGMGEVWRVIDTRLDRAVALKVMRADAARWPALHRRFLIEARITAGLDHPGVVAVHDQGVLPDGRPWYTMREVRGGVTLREHWAALTGPLRQQQAVSSLLMVCQAMALSHSRGVIHRDLKPENVLLGPFGEILVLDWGLARRAADREGVEVGELPAEVATRFGTSLGTFPYLAPEQALGQPDQHGPWSDVYALGAMLYEALAGRAIFGPVDGPPTPLAEVAPDAPQELVDAAMACLARAPADRPAHAGWLAERLAAWRDGVFRHERALAHVARAVARRPAAEALRAQAAARLLDAERGLRALPPFAAPAEKRRWWAVQDEAAALAQEARAAELEVDLAFRAALEEAPGLPEARAGLAALFRARLAEAEAAGTEAPDAEALLRLHGEEADRAWLDAGGELVVHTAPPGLAATLLRYRTHDRRLVLEPIRPLGPTPLRADVGRGSFVLRLSDGRRQLDLPFVAQRGARVDLTPRGPLSLPDDAGPDDVAVPPGWFLSGGDPDAPDAAPLRRVWLDGFFLRRFPVTNAEYLEFLNDLVAQGREAEAVRHAPQDRLGPEEPPRAVLTRDAAGRFQLGVDAAGCLWRPRWPVTLVDWYGARAYADWLARRTGLPWRLPHSLEWEKAARGADGRRFPWGDHFEPAWANLAGSRPGPAGRLDVDAVEEDLSPYGARGMAGNVRDWCLDLYEREPGEPSFAAPSPGPDDLVNLRGGAWSSAPAHARAAMRLASRPDRRLSALGLRLCRAWPGVS